MNFTRKTKCLYIDAQLLKDEDCLWFLIDVSHCKIPIIVYMETIMEKADYETYEAMDYVSDIINGCSMDVAIQKDIAKKGIAEKHIAVLSTCECHKNTYFMIGEQGAYQNIKDYMEKTDKEVRGLKIGICTLFICSILGLFLTGADVFVIPEKIIAPVVVISFGIACISMGAALYYRMEKFSYILFEFLDGIL